MDPKNQLQTGNDYTPSKRAAAAVRTATGSGSGAKPDHADVFDKTAPDDKTPAKQNAGGSVPSEKQQASSGATDEVGTTKKVNDFGLGK